MRVAFVIDALDSLDPSIDTSVGLMHAVQDRGLEVWATDALSISVIDGRARARARRVALAPSVRANGHRWTVPEPWCAVDTSVNVWLDEMGAVFMRTDPPVDETYLNATFVLDLVDRTRTAMVNDPRGLRAYNEKLYALRFTDLVPQTIVTADAAIILGFVADHGRAVVKPIDGYAGHGVLQLVEGDPNLRSLIEVSTRDGRRAVVVQRYLEEVTDGNKRLFVLDGVPTAAVFRYPADGDFRIGNPTAEAPITDRDREICSRLAPSLARHGLRMVGLDVIGPWLIEVNVTSPGALRKADALLGTTLCADLVDAVVIAPVAAGSREGGSE